MVGKGEEWTNKKQSPPARLRRAGKEKVRSFERGLVVMDLYKNFKMNCLDGHQVIIDYQRCRAPSIFVEYITPDKIQVRSTVIL
jgi:hypothetical protein